MGGILGACHASEIPFVFDSLSEKPRGINSARNHQTDELSAKMMDSWAAFAKTGNPSHNRIDSWKRYDPKTRSTMILGIHTHLEDDPFGEERKLWEGMA